jgi:GTP-binding protein LepA
MAIENTRNFCIIAHIDHGKTTLSDRLLEATGTIQNGSPKTSCSMRWIWSASEGSAIKAHPIAMEYTSKSGGHFKLNLSDTPGHVDFSYEVSRSLAACEGALLIIDAAQGVEAQTVANVHLAEKQGLKLIPVINKIDLPNADVENAKRQLEDILAIPAEEAILASAKAGIGIQDILEAVVERIPHPAGKPEDRLRALTFDSHFDTYRGVVIYTRVMEGSVKAGDQVKLMATNSNYEVKEVGVFKPQQPKFFAREKLHRRQHRLCHCEHQDILRSQSGRHPHQRPPARRGAAAWLPGRATDGFQRHLSHQHR